MESQTSPLRWAHMQFMAIDNLCIQAQQPALPRSLFVEQILFKAAVAKHSSPMSCHTACLSCRLIEDKQNLLTENIQLRADLLNLQRDHVALLQLVSVLQQQHQQYDGPTPLHSPLYGNYSALPSPSAQPSRYMQQQPQIARTSNTPRQSPGRDSSPAVPMSRKSIPISSTKKPKLHRYRTCR